MPSNLRGYRFPDCAGKGTGAPKSKVLMLLLAVGAALTSAAVLGFVGAVLFGYVTYNFCLRDVVPSLPPISLLNAFGIGVLARVVRFLVTK